MLRKKFSYGYGYFCYYLFLIFNLTSIKLIVGQNNFEIANIDNKASIKGLRETDYYAFRGIPYAEPPIEDKRWTDPVLKAATTLDGYDATKFGSKCLQYSRSSSTGGSNVIGDENCLFLNIYTRNLPQVGGVATSRPAIPVIFYIHPGGFMYGSGENFGPAHFLKYKDIVLVTINYRLGVMGFLSTNDENLAGNFGLLDQIVALEWVNLYIRYFGGDARRITIMGHSAGAGSTHALTLSPLAKDLFSGAIIQSGSALCDWFIEKNPQKYANEISQALDCGNLDDDSDSSALVQCLKGKNGSSLIQTQYDQLKFWVLPTHTTPIVDAGLREFPVLPAHPLELITNAEYTKVPMIVGVTKDEGFMGYSFLHLHEMENFTNNEYFHDTLIPKIISNLFNDKTEGEIKVISNAVEEYYFHGINVSTFNGEQMAITEMTNLFGDTMFYSCHWNMLEKYAATNQLNVYNYVFSYKRNKSPKILAQVIRELQMKKVHHPLFDYGIPHGEDMFYFFNPMKQFPGNELEVFSEQDMEVVEFVTRLWVSFAETRIPSVTDIRHQYPGWRPITSSSVPYYVISGNKSEMGTDFRKGEALFWLRTIPLLQNSQAEIDELESVPYKLLFWILLALSIIFLVLIIGLIVVLLRKKRTGKATL